MNEKKKRKKILILDDEIGIRELIGEILTDEGYAVIALEKAEQAWKARVEENHLWFCWIFGCRSWTVSPCSNNGTKPA